MAGPDHGAGRRPDRLAGLRRLRHADGDHRLGTGEGVDARRVPEDVGGGAGQPVDQPGLAVVVVHRERAVRLQVLADRGHRLLGEEERLQPDLRGPAHQGQRVGQREEHEVVGAVRALEERAAVVGVHAHVGVVVRPVDVVLAADLEDARVDVDGVDAVGALAQRDRDVRAGAGADDEHVAEGVARGSQVRRLVDPLALLDLPLRGGHQLVRDAVRLDQQEAVVRRDDVVGLDLVVRRPGDARESWSPSAACRSPPPSRLRRPGDPRVCGSARRRARRRRRPTRPTAPAGSSAA